MKYENKIYIDGVCIDHANIDKETAIKIQELLTQNNKGEHNV